ncbi:MAG: MaoC family dehydratase N-terminal domain-containing protein [Acidimicrobiia bacterium]|nr:MaoC family dehydratase N-terminal domain-containing protein [Acidimicrobiia bacterium]
MAVDLSLLGTPSEPFDFDVEGERAKAYAAATNDENPKFVSGELAPPVFAVVPVFDALAGAAVGLIPSEYAMFIVHGEQDMHFHQPLKPGVTLSTTTTPFAVRGAGSGTRITIETKSSDQSTGEPVCTQYFTVFVRGLTGEEDGGSDKPTHDFPDTAREKPVGEPYVVHVDDDQTFRYRDASGDMMPIHVDDDFAKQVGLPGIIAHGLCTMAMCSQAVVERACGGDPAKLRRLAVRMAANVFPGNDVEVQLYEAGTTDGGAAAFAFEATSAGAVVIKNGWAEVG